MAKLFFAVLLTAAILLTGLGSLAAATPGAKSVVTQVPGNTVVQDDAQDFVLINAVPGKPDRPCSLPPDAPSMSPPWTDIKTAKITQLGRGWVEITNETEASSIQDNYPPAPQRVYYRLTQKGIEAGEEFWSNPLFTLYPEIGLSHMKRPN
ncbi:hypothetical protein ACFLVN_04650 [Chloroflexota bacterium]